MTMVKNFRQLVDKLEKFENTQTYHPKWLFRDQTDCEWTLKPSLTRIAEKRKLDRIQALQLEREALEKFAISGSKLLPLEYTINLTLAGFIDPIHSHINNPTFKPCAVLDFIGWFIVMRHYGAPTRLLDWSCSPWVALYFACYEQHNINGVLWIVDFVKANKYAETIQPGIHNIIAQRMREPTTPDTLVNITALNTNQRIESQQARFSVCTNPLTDHLLLLQKAEAIEKIEIPEELKPNIMINLYQMNISAKTLFPGIDGLGRSITEYCNLWDTSSRIE